MWIYITGYIAAFIAFIIAGLKEEGVITFGDLLLIIVYSFASWATFIAILIVFLIDKGFCHIAASNEDFKEYYEGFIAGAKLADKTMIDKACEWLDGNFPSIDNVGSWYKESFIKQFKKAMES